MAEFGSDLLQMPSTAKKRKWTDKALIVVLGLIITFFAFAVLSNGFQLLFQHSLFGK